MRKEISYYGDNRRTTESVYDSSISRKPVVVRTTSCRRSVSRPRRRKVSLAIVAVAVLAVAGMTLALSYHGLPKYASRTSAITQLPGFTLSYQHSDNTIPLPCNWCSAFMGWHFVVPVLWDDVKYGGAPLSPPGDNMYGAVGSFDDCPHCIVYSGPASLQMIIAYRSAGLAPPQDMIYDIGELDTLAGESPGNGFVERHGVGMTDGSGVAPAEIQFVFSMLIGPLYQHNQWDSTALTPSQLMNYILGLYPVIWDDHAGWPSNMDPTWPTMDPKEQGHYKVIAGYDDQGTPSTSDDYALIYDPWPGYNDIVASNPTPLPPGAIPGPGGANAPDPYWLPVGSVFGDTNDLFIVETAAIPEFSGLLVPIVGMTVIALVAIRIHGARRES